MCLFIKMSSSSSICIEVAHLLQSSLWEWREGGDDKGGSDFNFFGGAQITRTKQSLLKKITPFPHWMSPFAK